ncbi:TetR/AcrR family transcriptional regulator [Paenibacillus senegalensis]|uniref:TetR/AcrR family transcriptional regulator n=1 Tax=Paenibacillus senegalensis TaxID=1465766 RepID=UPI0002882C89|nr:TetR/AcrR family transcriptional regulator [Paenibacillus senegalensis]
MPKTKGERSRDKLLASAEELFAEKGYHGTTVSQIVSYAGMTQAAFYLYFKSKEDLLAEMLQHFEKRLELYTNTGIKVREVSAGEIEEFLAHSYTGLFKLFGENAHLTKIVLQETEQSERLRGSIVSQIVGNMRINQAAGLIRPDLDPELMAEAAVAAIEQLVYRFGITGERSAEELGRELAKLLCHGLLAKGGRQYAAEHDHDA